MNIQNSSSIIKGSSTNDIRFNDISVSGLYLDTGLKNDRARFGRRAQLRRFSGSQKRIEAQFGNTAGKIRPHNNICNDMGRAM